VNQTLRLIGVLDSGETPSTTESNDALDALNQLITSWSAAGVPIYAVAKDTLALTGAPSYTIGTGGNITTARPVKLKSAQVVNGGVSMPIEIVTAEVWVQIKDRTMTGKFAQQLYYDGAYPLGTLALWPSPVTGSSLELYSLKPLAGFAALGDTINLPPGYEHALKYNLAAVLAPDYGRALAPEVNAEATVAKAAIASLNAQVLGPPLPAMGPAAAAPAA
jgi:hypothetical protein